MSSESLKQQVESLDGLLLTLDNRDDLPKDRWLGKRYAPRYSFSMSVTIQVLTDKGVGPPVEYPLYNISKDGLCFISQIYISPGTWLRASISVNDVSWSGCICVAHCTETVGGIKIGAFQKGTFDVERTKDPSQEITTAIQSSLREMQSLRAIAEEIYKVVRAYDIARLSWGILGTSLRKRIKNLVGEVPEVEPEIKEKSRRRYPRKSMHQHVQLIVKTNYGRKRINARLTNVSEGGACLRIKNHALEDPIEREMTGGLLIRPETTIILGIGQSGSMLWVPAQVRRMKPIDENETEIGVEFVTDKSLAKLKKHI